MTKKAVKKYELVKSDTVRSWDGCTLYRIKALVAIAAFGVAAGDIGGYVESEKNLSQVSGDAWVSGDARVYGNARVYGDAWVYGNARVYGNAQVYGDAQVYGNAQVSGDAWVYGNARVSGDARVYGNAWVSGNAQVYGNARVYGNAQVSGWLPFAGRSDGYTFILVPQRDGDPVIIAGCQYRTVADYRAHTDEYRDEAKKAETLLILDFLEAQAAARFINAREPEAPAVAA